MGTVFELIKTRRSVRKFRQDPISLEKLLKLVEAARFAPSAANIQPCEYVIVNSREKVNQIFPLLKWAGYIHPHGIPGKGEEPSAYIAVLISLKKKKKKGEVDASAAIQNMLLTAWELGIGSCWIKSVKRRSIKKILRIPHNVQLDSVIAFGYPAENPVTEEAAESIKYYKDDKGILHVPKRSLSSIVFNNQYGLYYDREQLVVE